MAADLKPLREYARAVARELGVGNTTEHSHRPALKGLLEALDGRVVATNEPKRIACGAPDFVVTRGASVVGYIEGKDVGSSLDDAERSEQMERYLPSLSNLVLTDYLSFRWYVDGHLRLSARLGRASLSGKVLVDRDGLNAVADLLASFLCHTAEGVGTPRELAERLARLARLARGLIANAIASEAEAGPLHGQLAAFRDNLIPDLSPERFADMYAQTMAYGLFAARCAADGGCFTRQNAGYLLPRTNPFLRNLFGDIAGPNLDDRVAWLADDLAQVLAQADMDAVLRDFGRRTATEDPVVHFYETFLGRYDPRERQVRGVYYTPEPVVSYIVRSVDHLLRTRFNSPEGLADPRVLILDPAVGTGTFLYSIVRKIHEAFVRQGQGGLWNDYVADRLLRRLFGFELLMAPYAVAHLKLGLLLRETGYRFQADQRLGVYLTNTLEEAFTRSQLLAGFNRYIVDEANAAARIKKEKPIMVVLGNPPYAGFSANASTRMVKEGRSKRMKRDLTWIGRLIQDYKQVDGGPLGERNPKWLQDDYVKFIRFGQWRIEQTGHGILAFITNHGYLDNPTFRGMRQSLMNTFSDIYVLDLHGNVKKRESAPDGGPDQNVFDIQQGVAIGIFVREPGRERPGRVQHADLWGARGDWPDPEEGTKYRALAETDVSTTSWEPLAPATPAYFFVPRDEVLAAEYHQGWKVTDIFPLHSAGIVTARDSLAVAWSAQEMWHTLADFASLEPEAAREKYRLGADARDWSVSMAQADVTASGPTPDRVVPLLYRPFDVRFTYYTGRSRGFQCMPRPDVMRHMLGGANVALITVRKVPRGQAAGYFSAARFPASNGAIRSDNQSIDYVIPLYAWAAQGEMQFQGEPRRANLNPAFSNAVSDALALRFVAHGSGDLEQSFGPEDVFHYIYAVLHSPAYRSRYADFLKTDFPRVPLTSERGLFAALAAKGAQLVALHLMESPLPATLITGYPVAGTDIVERVSYDAATGRVHINKTQYFDGVPRDVWEFHVGGYQVCHKWLKDRKGRKLAYDDKTHYQRVVVALNETVRLMAEIDALIPSWPID
ncbi:MAG: type ISP restriction/modification enzyme [Chloroflexota bacterium]|nr:type ISP restriction/modification enzyme [Chloroflexota bacterium]